MGKCCSNKELKLKELKLKFHFEYFKYFLEAIINICKFTGPSPAVPSEPSAKLPPATFPSQMGKFWKNQNSLCISHK